MKVTVNGEMIDERLDVTQLSVASRRSHGRPAASATKTNDPAMKENEDFITHFPLTVAGSHS